MKTDNLIYWLSRIVDCGKKGMLAIKTVQAEFIDLEEENEKLRTMYAKLQKVLLMDEIKDILNREAMEVSPKPIEIKIVRDAEKSRIRIDKVIHNSDGTVRALYGLSFETGEWIEIPEGEKCLEEMICVDETHRRSSS